MGNLIDQDAIKRAIESSLWDDDGDTPHGWTVVDEPNRLYWCGPTNSLYGNRVVRVNFSTNDVDRAVSDILEFYSTRGKAFSWWVGPSSTPDDLGARLRDRGLTLLDTYEGVALPLMEPLPASPSGVQVQPVRDEAGVREMVAINAQMWGYSPADQERIVAERLAQLALPECRSGFILARVDNNLAGTANYRYSSDGKVIYLTGAATLPGFRSRGVFRAMVAYRLAQAQAYGATLATCLAKMGTSAPILARLGFERYFTLPVYTAN